MNDKENSLLQTCIQPMLRVSKHYDKKISTNIILSSLLRDIKSIDLLKDLNLNEFDLSKIYEYINEDTKVPEVLFRNARNL